jgi:hypothetical protein
VGHYSLVHADVIVVTEVSELFSSELSVIVDNDRIWYPKMENDIFDEIYGLLRADLS